MKIELDATGIGIIATAAAETVKAITAAVTANQAGLSQDVKDLNALIGIQAYLDGRAFWQKLELVGDVMPALKQRMEATHVQ